MYEPIFNLTSSISISPELISGILIKENSSPLRSADSLQTPKIGKESKYMPSTYGSPSIKTM